MYKLAQKLVTKILIIPVIFGFALACCQPLFAEAADSHDEVTVEAQETIASSSSALTIQEGHHCDHAAHHEQSALQAPTQKTLFDVDSVDVSLSSDSSFQYTTIDSSFFVALPRITGPPWDGKSIKAFLGVYRS